MSHPLIGGGSADPSQPANEISYDSGGVHIDATPIYLFGIILISAGVLAAFKASGFKFVIGVG